MEVNQRVDVVILLSTYNGAIFIKELLNSLLIQTYKDWVMFIHDDGSNDTTNSIIDDYCCKYSNIQRIDIPERLGAKESFLRMMMEVEANYYFFCDQDDIWKEDKVEKSLSLIKEMERQYVDVPLIVHSDLEVTDENLNIVSTSFWKQSGINIKKLTTFNRIGAHNLVTGCTMLINHRAKEAVVYPAPNATMHDAWISLCVLKNGGGIYGIEEPLIKYRQHSNNTLGVAHSQKRSLLYKVVSIKEVFNNNIKGYKMLKDLNYGTPFKYLFYKIIIALGF